MSSRWAELPPSSSAGGPPIMDAPNSPARLGPELRQGLGLGLGLGPGSGSNSVSEGLLSQLGGFLREEQPSGSKQIYCVYRNLTNVETPIRLVCELGCCPDGCCALDEYAQRWTMDYSWALLLLAVFIACVLASSLIMAALYCFNRRRLQRRHHGVPIPIPAGSDCGASTADGGCYHLEFGSTTYSKASTSSQVSPQHFNHCGGSLYGLPTYYPDAQTFRSVH